MSTAGNPRVACARTSESAHGVAVVNDPEVAELEGLLEGLLAEHEQLLMLAAEHRDAISKADPYSLGDCVQRQGEVMERVAGLEKRRLALVGRLVDKMRPLGKSVAGGARQPDAVPDRPTISWIARTLPEPVRSRLVALAERLRELLARLQREHAALKEASLALAGHMEGLMRQLSKRLSHAGTYGRTGMVESRVQVVSALDLRS
jgi:hypothetical protein